VSLILAHNRQYGALACADRWDAVRDCFEDAAARFCKEQGRPATLVIDGVEFLSASPALMKSLVQFAKVVAGAPFWVALAH
jgi:hypothetical protein